MGRTFSLICSDLYMLAKLLTAVSLLQRKKKSQREQKNEILLIWTSFYARFLFFFFFWWLGYKRITGSFTPGETLLRRHDLTYSTHPSHMCVSPRGQT